MDNRLHLCLSVCLSFLNSCKWLMNDDAAGNYLVPMRFSVEAMCAEQNSDFPQKTIQEESTGSPIPLQWPQQQGPSAGRLFSWPGEAHHEQMQCFPVQLRPRPVRFRRLRPALCRKIPRSSVHPGILDQRNSLLCQNTRRTFSPRKSDQCTICCPRRRERFSTHRTARWWKISMTRLSEPRRLRSSRRALLI